ncbi:DUF2568 domain-containing protein, partial [Lactobacillus sp. XV13L]|nr:DUF2568 domain-containing protein [Lactobacillus sp. XV13L]
MSQFLIAVNTILRFLIEVFTVILFVSIGFMKFKFPVNLLVGLVLPAIIAVVWSIFVAPMSTRRASVTVRV